MVTITPMTEADISEAIELWTHCEGVSLSEGDSAQDMQFFLKRNPGLSYVARDGPRLVAVAMAGHDGRRGYLYHVAVAPSLRRRGIGRTIVERCLSALSEAGIRKCHLFVFHHNEHAMKFWKSLGWKGRSDLQIMSVFSDSEQRQ
jgi:N-acetylglutamate synthase